MAASTVSVGAGGISEPFTHGQEACASSSILHPGQFGNSEFPNLSDGGWFFYKIALVFPVGPGTPSSCCLASSRPVKDWGRKKEIPTLGGRSQGRHLELVEVVGAVSHGDFHCWPPIGQGAAHLTGGQVCRMH